VHRDFLLILYYTALGLRDTYEIHILCHTRNLVKFALIFK